MQITDKYKLGREHRTDCFTCTNDRIVRRLVTAECSLLVNAQERFYTGKTSFCSELIWLFENNSVFYKQNLLN